MSDLDWSQAPKDADKIVENPTSYDLHWANDRGVLIVGEWMLCSSGYNVIATRPAESEVERQKERQKWTHEYCGDSCYVKCAEPDIDGFIVIVTREDGYMLVEPADIQPITIKPKISKAEAWVKMQSLIPTKGVEDAYFAVKANYNIKD